MINELLAPNLCSFLVSISPGDLGAERRGSGCSWWAGLPGQCQREHPVRLCSRARAHTGNPCPHPCPAQSLLVVGLVQSLRMLEGVHCRKNMSATCPVIQKILLCWPPSPQTMLLPWQPASPNQSLLRASQLTPSWVLCYTWFTQPRVLDSHNADVHGPSEVAGWLWGQKCKLQGSEGLG